MIGRLRGELVDLTGTMALIEAGGVGYEVAVPDHIALALPPSGECVTLLIRQIFREDGVSLYGFAEPFQRRVFDLLLGVKGCGPKVALALLGQVGEDSVATAILQQDTKTLVKASGVGVRLADRIILELKDKMAEETASTRARMPREAPSIRRDDLLDTLLSLGYRRQEAEAAAETARDTPGALQEQIKHALRLLQKARN